MEKVIEVVNPLNKFAVVLMIGQAQSTFEYQTTKTAEEVRHELADQLKNSDIFEIEDATGIAMAFVTRDMPIQISVIPGELYEKMQRNARMNQ
jgi:hypothetical protein